jgi:hypothetical protein
MNPSANHTATPAGIIGMPGWFASEQVAGFDRNRWLVSSEYASKAKGYRWEALRVPLKEVGLLEGKPGTHDDHQGEQRSKNGHGGTSVCSSQNSCLS